MNALPSPIPRTARFAIGVVAALAVLLLGAALASAQTAPTTLTVRVGIVPATDPGRFDLAIDGIALAVGVGDGGATAAQTVLPGTLAVSETPAPGTVASAYATTVTCVDGVDVLLSAVPASSVTVAVAEGHAVVCTFTNTVLPVAPVAPVAPVVAPPVTATPILLPPPFVRGSAVLLGIEGCTARETVTTKVIGRNIARIVFIRDGRIVKRVKAPSLTWRAYTVTTRLSPDDRRLHTVLVRTYFIDGATPRVKAMVHRFSHCRASAVVG